MNKPKPYYLNSNGTLHIHGACKNSEGYPNSVERHFDTEHEVMAYAGLSYKWCKECVEWREKVIRKAIESQK